MEDPVLNPWEDNLDGGGEGSPALPPDDPLATPEPLPTTPEPFTEGGNEDRQAPTPADPVVPNGAGEDPGLVAPPAPLVPAPAPPPPLTSS
ncbi:MAG: hypothetical protein HC929_08385 [Leptolyngbyaceae cyanobacterium SM2_5_2]|nr:hypothetical protein [Leptolyngbyaceae cyanobacterium SM2_5_2]